MSWFFSAARLIWKRKKRWNDNFLLDIEAECNTVLIPIKHLPHTKQTKKTMWISLNKDNSPALIYFCLRVVRALFVLYGFIRLSVGWVQRKKSIRMYDEAHTSMQKCVIEKCKDESLFSLIFFPAFVLDPLYKYAQLYLV